MPRLAELMSFRLVRPTLRAQPKGRLRQELSRELEIIARPIILVSLDRFRLQLEQGPPRLLLFGQVSANEFSALTICNCVTAIAPGDFSSLIVERDIADQRGVDPAKLLRSNRGLG